VGKPLSGVSSWRLFAFMDGDPDGVHDESRTVTDWQLGDVLRWCQTRGYDHVYFCRVDERVTFEKRPVAGDVVHHFG
jgi:hypothetical protein